MKSSILLIYLYTRYSIFTLYILYTTTYSFYLLHIRTDFVFYIAFSQLDVLYCKWRSSYYFQNKLYKQVPSRKTDILSLALENEIQATTAEYIHGCTLFFFSTYTNAHSIFWFQEKYTWLLLFRRKKLHTQYTHIPHTKICKYTPYYN